MDLVLASGNAGKLREMRALCQPLGIEVRPAHELGFTAEVPETGDTFLENALIKAKAVSRALGMPVLADDSGLTVTALGGAPGVFSARYAGPQADDQANWEKLLSEMQGFEPAERGAAFVCVLACRRPDGGVLSAEGRLEGGIATHPAGDNGFGYDPVFVPSGYDRTVAQLSPQEKNAISHRAQALASLMTRLKSFLSGE